MLAERSDTATVGVIYRGVVNNLAGDFVHRAHQQVAPAHRARRVYERAGAPKRMWIIDAADHRFSNQATEFSQRLIEAMDWVAAVDR